MCLQSIIAKLATRPNRPNTAWPQARLERGRLGSGGGGGAVCSRLRDEDDLAGKRPWERTGGPPAAIAQRTPWHEPTLARSWHLALPHGCGE